MASPRPMVDKSLALSLLKQLFPIAKNSEPEIIRELPSYEDRNFHARFRLENEHDTREFVFKVYHQKRSGNIEFLDAHTELSRCLSQANVMCPMPAASRQGTFYCLKELPHPLHSKAPSYAIRLFNYIPGVTMKHLGHPSDTLLQSFGECVADLGQCMQALRGTDTEATIREREVDWDITDTLQWEPYVPGIPDPAVREMVQGVLNRFRKEILPHLGDMPSGVIHGDLNDANVLINPENLDDVHGVIDTGDIMYAPLVADLGIALAYMSLFFVDSPVESVAPVVKGYCAKRPLNELERNLLPLWLMTRLVQSISLGYNAYRQEPDNEYLLVSVIPALSVLPKILNMSPNDIQQVWYSGLTNENS